jgi:hypothetical protein
MSEIKHVLGISGGKDSAALAVYMRHNHPELDLEYFFTDTGKELPEVYEFLGRLEGLLGKSILYLNPDRDFDHWLKKFNYFLPSPQTRWCTKQLKLLPFEKWVKPMLNDGMTVYSYVAIRADEEFRGAYNSKHKNLIIKLPFKEEGIDKAGVHELLEISGLGLPSYYDWRSRSGCTFCFYQQKIEWVGLLERHPDAFKDAMTYEKTALENDSPFTWTQDESLIELSQPERVQQIKSEYAKKVEKLKTRRTENPLRPDTESIDMDDVYGQAKGCVACHK